MFENDIFRNYMNWYSENKEMVLNEYKIESIQSVPSGVFAPSIKITFVGGNSRVVSGHDELKRFFEGLKK